MGKYFGTDGFRGEANIQLTVDHALSCQSSQKMVHDLKMKDLRRE